MKLLAGNSNAPLARSISDYLEIPLTDASVRRFADEEVFVEINENVRGEDVFVVQSTSYPANDNLMELLIFVDDIVDSAGTLCNAAAALKQQGATEVFAYCTHGVLSGGAATRVAKSELTELVVTDTIWTGEADPKDSKIRRLTIAPLLAEAVRRIADESSVSSL